MIKRICFALGLICYLFVQLSIAEDYDSLKQECRKQQYNLSSEQNISVCHTCLGIRPNDGDIFAYIANWYLNGGQLDQCNSWLEKGWRTDDNNAALHLVRGIYNFQNGQLDSAKMDIEKATVINPKYFEAYYSLGRLHFINKEFEIASNYYKKAVELNPESAPYNFFLAFCYEQTTNPSRAHEYYEKVLSLNPESKDILFLTYSGLGNSYYFDKKEYDKAIVNYAKAIKIKKDYNNYCRIADSYNLIGDYQNGLKWANEAIEQDKSMTIAYFKRGKAYLELGEKEKAINDYEKVTGIDPKSSAAYYNLGLIYDDGRHENLTKAIEYYKSAYDRSTVEEEKGHLKQKIDDLTAALNLPPLPEEIAEKYDLPTVDSEFSQLVEQYWINIDYARNQFQLDKEKEAYEYLNEAESTHNKLKNFISEYELNKGRSRSSLEYYLQQKFRRIVELTELYEKIQQDFLAKKEENIKKKEELKIAIEEARKNSSTEALTDEYIAKLKGINNKSSNYWEQREKYAKKIVENLKISDSSDDEIIKIEWKKYIDYFNSDPMTGAQIATNSVQQSAAIGNYYKAGLLSKWYALFTLDTGTIATTDDKILERANRAEYLNATANEISMFVSDGQEYQAFLNMVTDYYYKTPTRAMAFNLEQRKKILVQK